jgi:NAD(P)-dependent dehydrogenase (short-subunit alcohol dehydrogenase family)
MMIKTVLITGANGGLGKETARRLAMMDVTKKVYLACRSQVKAEAAKRSLEESTGRSIFDIVVLDTSDLNSVRSAVDSINGQIEGLVMNAGGIVGKDFADRTVDGVTQMLAANLLGHVVLLEALLKSQKLTDAAIFSGSEAARGVPQLGLKKPRLHNHSVDEFVSVCDGSFFGEGVSFLVAYQYVKFMGALYMASMARKHTNQRFMTVSPGSTLGTDLYKNAPLSTRIPFKILTSLPIKAIKERNFHGVEAGAQRYVDALNGDSYKSGAFYASKKSALTGPMVNQGDFFADLNNEQYQDNAYEALHRFI